MRAAPGIVSVDRGGTKVAHRVERGKVDWSTKGAGVGQLQVSEDGWRRRAI